MYSCWVKCLLCNAKCKSLGYDSTWNMVHIDVSDIIQNTIIIICFSHTPSLLLVCSFNLRSTLHTSVPSVSISHPDPPPPTPLFNVSRYFLSFILLWLLFHSILSPASLCSLALDYSPSICPSLFNAASLFQVRGGQQGLFSSGTDARCPRESMGHVGGLPGEHLCEGPPAPLGSLCHHLLPPRLPPPEREQVPQIPGKGEKGDWEMGHLCDSSCLSVVG